MKYAAHLLDCLAASYRLDLDGPAYLKHVVAAAAPMLDRGLGILAYTYDARDPTQPTIDHRAVAGAFDPAWLPHYNASLAEAGLDADPRRPTGFAAWRHMTSGQASAVRGMQRYLPSFARLGGARDTLAVNALDASGRGLWLGAPLRTTRRVAERDIVLFSRLASHLTAALRLRRAAAPVRPTAVMAPSGKLLHAEHAAAKDMRDELRRAVLGFDGARTREARTDVERATRRWKPLVASTWSLLDEFDADGKRFIVAVDNGPPTRRPAGALSERENQVLTQAHLGHTNKEIAYELGLSSATVRVMMMRAARKLGAATRVEAIARFDALLRRTDPT